MNLQLEKSIIRNAAHPNVFTPEYINHLEAGPKFDLTKFIHLINHINYFDDKLRFTGAPLSSPYDEVNFPILFPNPYPYWDNKIKPLYTFDFTNFLPIISNEKDKDTGGLNIGPADTTSDEPTEPPEETI